MFFVFVINHLYYFCVKGLFAQTPTSGFTLSANAFQPSCGLSGTRIMKGHCGGWWKRLLIMLSSIQVKCLFLIFPWKLCLVKALLLTSGIERWYMALSCMIYCPMFLGVRLLFKHPYTFCDSSVVTHHMWVDPGINAKIYLLDCILGAIMFLFCRIYLCVYMHVCVCEYCGGHLPSATFIMTPLNVLSSVAPRIAVRVFKKAELSSCTHLANTKSFLLALSWVWLCILFPWPRLPFSSSRFDNTLASCSSPFPLNVRTAALSLWVHLHMTLECTLV